jgi:hypothetical protein
VERRALHLAAWRRGHRARVDLIIVERLGGHSANHFVGGVALPADTHTIELRYAPPSLRIGLLVTALTVAALVASLTLLVLHRLSHHRIAPSLLQAPASPEIGEGAVPGHSD